MSRAQNTQWLFGVNPVREALRAGREVKTLFLAVGRHRGLRELRREAEERGVPVTLIHDPRFFDRRFPKGHQGVAAEVPRAVSLTLEDILEIPARRGEPPLLVLLDGIEDPRNLGAVLRSAEAAGVHGVIMEERRSARLSAVAAKASAGAAEHLAVARVVNLKRAMEVLAEAGIPLVGAETGPHPPPWDVDLRGPLGLVVGAEGAGIRRTVRERCNRLVALPMRGHVGSLNASVAAAVVLFEYLRQNPELS